MRLTLRSELRGNMICVSPSVNRCNLLVYYPGCHKQYPSGITTVCRSALGEPDADFCNRCEPADLVRALEMFYTHSRGPIHER